MMKGGGAKELRNSGREAGSKGKEALVHVKYEEQDIQV